MQQLFFQRPSRGPTSLVAGAAAVAALVLSGCNGSNGGPNPVPTPTSRPSLGQIVFQRVGDIYVMNPDGSGQRRLTTHLTSDLDP